MAGILKALKSEEYKSVQHSNSLRRRGLVYVIPESDRSLSGYVTSQHHVPFHGFYSRNGGLGSTFHLP